MNHILYNSIGTGYNIKRCADAYLAERFYQLLCVSPNGLYLDIGCGTGNYTIALQEKGLKIMGVDPSEKMLQQAMQRSSNVSWVAGAAEKLPLEDKLFDGIMGMLTIHHWTDLHSAFTELSRVLKGNGKIVLFTSTPEQMEGYWLNHYFPLMMKESLLQMPSLEKIRSAATAAGLEIADTEKYFIKDKLQDHFLYVGKNKPELYFDETIRNGISSFAAIAHVKEVNTGLQTLRNDIDKCVFPKIGQQYENDMGDYIFVILQKKK
jgi:ubiquinone/menaquinone biosynthesis C-methylase UbiE